MAKRLQAFFFAPTSAEPLAALRIGVCALLLLQAFLCAPLYFDWYGTNGLLQHGVTERFAWGILQTTRISGWLAPHGISERATLLTLAGLYLASLAGLLLGWHTRASALVAWLLHTLFTQQHLTSYGFDLLSQIALFYCVWIPCGKAWSVDVAWRGVDASPTSLTRLALRVCQIHLAIVYLASGIEKAMGEQWWSGEAIWRSLMLPIYAQYDLHALAWVPWLAKLFAWGTLVIEIGYPFFIFWRRTRPLWLLAIVGLHLGIAVFLGLHLFAALMALFSLSLFGVSLLRSPATIKAYSSRRQPDALART